MQAERKNLTWNFWVNVLDGGFFGFAIGASSFVTVLPLFVSQLTDSALLLALIPAIHTLGWQLPQILTASHVARLRRYLPFVLQMTLHERLPYLGLILIALFLPRLDARLALVLIFALLVWQGFGGGFTATAWQSMVAKLMPPRRVGLFFGMQSAAASLGGALAAALSGWLLARLVPTLNFAACFTITFLAMTVSIGFLAATREQPHVPEAPPQAEGVEFGQRLGAILQGDANFAWYLGCRWLSQIGLIGLAFYSVYAVEELGASAALVGLFTSAMLVTQMVCGPLLGWLGDRWGHRRVIAGGMAALAGSASLAWAAPSAGWFLPVFMLAGIAQAVTWAPSIAIVIDFAPIAERQTYIGLANTVMAPAAILAPLAGGWLADGAGYEAAFLASAVGALLTALLLVITVRDPQRHHAVLVPAA